MLWCFPRLATVGLDETIMDSEEEMLEEIKEAVKMCHISGEFFRLSIIPYELNGEKGYNIKHSQSHKRVDFLTFEAACKWCSVYFMVAQTMTRESVLAEDEDT